MYVIYRFFIPLYFLGIRWVSFFRHDANLWVEGRKQFFQKIQEQKQRIPINTTSQWIWIHCSSLGEFEQGRVLIEKLKTSKTEIKIWLSFFSPSGYTQQKEYPHADIVSYFPSDRYDEAKKFIEIIHPTLVIFIKYDFWWNSLSLLLKKEIPFIFVSSLFPKNHYLFSWWANSFRKILKQSDHIFLQNKYSLDNLEKFGFTNCSIAGDTRLDRILELAVHKKKFPDIESFLGTKKVWVMGSVWRADIVVLKPIIERAIASDWKIIIVPHQVDKDHIQEMSMLLKDLNPSVYTKRIENGQSSILIVDTIGMLSSLYQYANFVYVGGGFGKSIHNVLEPLVHGKYVAFGPHHTKFPEAGDMIQRGLGFEIKDQTTATLLWEKLHDNSFLEDRILLSKRYITKEAGASEKIYLYISEKYFRH